MVDIIPVKMVETSERFNSLNTNAINVLNKVLNCLTASYDVVTWRCGTAKSHSIRIKWTFVKFVWATIKRIKISQPKKQISSSNPQVWFQDTKINAYK